MTGEVTSRAAIGGQRYVERLPLRPLRPLVSSVWVHQIGHGAGPYLHRRVPHGAVELVCRIGSPPQVVGPILEPTVEVLEPGATVIGARFAPGAFLAVADGPATDLVGLSVGAEELWGRPAAALADAVGTAGSPSDALTALQSFVGGRAAAGRPPDPLVTAVVRGLMPGHSADVASLRATLHISETQLRRRCRRSIGIAPKTLHRLLRFQGFLALVQHAIAEGRAVPSGGLAGLALRAGYADQSHLTRECVRLTGNPPRAFLLETQRTCGRGHDHATSYEPVLRGLDSRT